MESCYSSPRSLSGLPCSSRKKESVLKIACKVPRTCGPVISVLAPLDPLVLCSRHIGFHAVPYTCCVLHLETFTQIIPSAHDVHPPDTCMAVIYFPWVSAQIQPYPLKLLRKNSNHPIPTLVFPSLIPGFRIFYHTVTVHFPFILALS